MMFPQLPHTMAAPSNWEKKHLWLYLQALGFSRAATVKKSGGRLRLGVTAFDLPNYGAFHVIVQFLFFKLDKKRAAKTFRKIMLSDGKDVSSEFRKQCNEWLGELSDKEGSGIPKVGGSLLCPSGRTFVHLMYRFARYVVIEVMRRNSAGSNKSFVGDVRLSHKGNREGNKRCRVACNELLQILLRKNCVIRKYDKTSSCLTKEIKQMKSEYAHLQQQLQKMEPKDQNKNDRAERIQKVRSMWPLVMETFTSLKKEMEIVDSVLGDCVNQYAFDGRNITVSVPCVLVDRVETEMQEVCIGNLYEDENLNFLTVIQLLNEALRILRDECYQFDLENHLQPFVDRIKLQCKMLSCLEAVRVRIEKQYFILNESNSKALKEWIIKWESSGCFSPCGQNLDLGELQTTLEAEENSEEDVLCPSPESLSDILEREINYENNAETLESRMVDSPLTATRWYDFNKKLI